MNLPSSERVLERLASTQPPFHHDGTQEQVWHAGPATLEFIAEAVHVGDRTVETGAGASTAVFAATGAHHTAISPEPDEHRRILEFCDSVDVTTDRLHFLQGFSEEVLPSYEPPEPLDLVFIDGKHSFPFPILDWHYLSHHLRVGGTMLLDDVQAVSVELLVRFMLAADAWELRASFDDEAVAFQKVTQLSPFDLWREQKLVPREEFEKAFRGSPRAPKSQLG